MHATTVAAGINALSGLLMIALGLFVALVRGGGRRNHAFALFAVAFGAAFVIDNLTREGGHLVDAGSAAMGLLLLAAGAGLALIGVSYPTRVSRADSRALVLAGLATGFTLVGLTRTYFDDAALRGRFEGETLPFLVLALGFIVFNAVAWGVLFLLALRRGTTPPEDTRARGVYTLMTTALILYPAFLVGALGPGLGLLQQGGVAPLVFAVILLGAYATAWAWSTASEARPGAAAWMPAFAAGAGLAGFLLSQGEWNNPGWGITRTFMVVVLAYAILRHQLLGIDVKVRWGVSKTTLAAVFIAVFFVASEAAQQFFGETLGSSYVGILAAGLLVFAIAPLSRLADRVAERAVPVAALEGGNADQDRARRIFERAVRAAVEDGSVTPSEEEHLAHIAHDLGIPHPEALLVRRRVEAEVTRP